MKRKQQIHIALDLDKTLAYKEVGSDPSQLPVGELIKPMKDKIIDWLGKGYKISIFTARVARYGKYGNRKLTSEINHQRKLVKNFLKENDLPEFDITAEKYGYFTHIVDDKAVPVGLNTGEILVDTSRQLLPNREVTYDIGPC